MRHKLVISLFIVLLIGLASILSVLQKRQEIRTRASETTRLYFSPESSLNRPIEKKPGDKFSLDVMIDPGGVNKISLLKLQIEFNSSAFEGTGKNTFVPNKDGFPTIMEGPVIDNDNGYIFVTLSVGASRLKAIQKAVKIGTINLVAKQSTNLANSIVIFDTPTKAFSTSPNDHAYENVIGSALPAYIAVAGDDLVIPTAAEATVAPTPTEMPTPTPQAPTPTPLPNDTVLSFETLLDGIGNAGDNTNPLGSNFSNKNPRTPKRNVTAFILTSSNQLYAQKNAFAIYNPSRGSFEGTINLGTNFPNGNYIVKLKSDGYLRRQLSGLISIRSASRTQLPISTLITGDINNDNKIDVLDYNLAMSCYSDIVANPNCSATNKKLTDLTDDNNVNNIDYNLFIREIGAQTGD